MRRLFRYLWSQLRFKIILPYLAVTLLVTMTGASVGMVFVASSLEERVQNLLAQVARSTTDALVRRERDHLEFLLLVASAPATTDRPSVADAFDSGDASQVARVLQPYYGLAASNINLDIDRMIAFDRSGKTYLDWQRVGQEADALPQSIEGTDMSQLEDVRRVVSGTLVDGNDKFSNLIYFLPDNQPYFYTVAPIKRGSTIVGGVMIGIKVDRLLTALQRSSQAAVTSFYDTGGKPIGTTLLTRAELEGLQMSPQVVQDLASGKAQSVYTVALRQRDYRLFYSPLFLAQQQVGYFSVGISADFQFQSLFVNRNFIVGMATLLGAASVLIGAWIARQINQPLTELVDTARAVTAGDFARRSAVHSGDEIGQLSQAFNQMTEHLLRLYTASRDLTTSIEVAPILEVTERTVRSFVPDSEVLALLEEEGTLRYRFGPEVSGQGRLLENVRVAPTDELLHELAERRSALATSPATDARLASLGLDLSGYASVLMTPLVFQDRPAGLLIFANQSPHAFTGAVEPTLTAVANMATSVLYNAMLFDRVQDEAGRSRAILESIADAVIVCDRQHNIVLANPAADRLLGLRQRQPSRVNFGDVPLVRIEGTQELFGAERGVEHYKIGEKIVTLSSAPVVVERGAVLGEVIVLHDISDEVALNTAKTNFIATISHELRSPLTVILGYTDLLLRGLVGELSAEQRELLEAVRSRVDLMTGIIKNVITVANIEANNLHTELEPHELWMAVDQAVSMVRGSFDKKGLQLSVQVPHDLPPVLADREQLQIILTALLDNARRYTSQGAATISAERHPGYIHISVTDTGPGIPPEQQGLLFTRFHRIEGNSSPERGSGLGLVITRQLVERQGGRVWVSSQVGSGSKFSFSLPIAHEHSDAITDQNGAGAQAG